MVSSDIIMGGADEAYMGIQGLESRASPDSIMLNRDKTSTKWRYCNNLELIPEQSLVLIKHSIKKAPVLTGAYGNILLSPQLFDF